MGCLTEAGFGQDVRIGQVLPFWYCVEQQQNDGLEAGHDEFLGCLAESSTHLTVCQSMLPIQLPSAVLALVVQLEVINRLLDIRWDDDWNVRVCRPGGGTENVNVQLDSLALRVTVAILEPLLIRLHLFTSKFHILEHLFKILGEATSALSLESGQHATLCIRTGATSHEQTTSQVFLVEGFKDSLPVHEAEKIEDLIELDVDLGVLV